MTTPVEQRSALGTQDSVIGDVKWAVKSVGAYMRAVCERARCASAVFACVGLQSIFGCQCWGVNVRERVLKVRHDAAMESELAPLACAPAVAWISFWYTDWGGLNIPLCLFCLYLSHRRKAKSNLPQQKNNKMGNFVKSSCSGTSGASILSHLTRW